VATQLRVDPAMQVEVGRIGGHGALAVSPVEREAP